MFSFEEVRGALSGDLIESRRGARPRFSGVSNDSRTLRPGDLFFALRGTMTERDGHDFVAAAAANGAAGVVVHRDVAVPDAVAVFRVSDTTHALGELASSWRDRFATKVTAVAGNVGKTTTKELTAALLGSRYHVLKSHSNFNDEIGLSMTLFPLTPEFDRAVVE